MADINRQGDIDVNIVDKVNQYSMAVDSDGSLRNKIRDATDATHILAINHDGSVNVITQRGNPAGTTAVNQGETATVSKNGGTDSYAWTIPNGETFQLQSIQFSGYFPSASADPINAKLLFYHRPNGSGNVTGQTLVGTIYLNWTSFVKVDFVDDTFTGDGTAVMEFVITNWSKTDTELAYYMRGYY